MSHVLTVEDASDVTVTVVGPLTHLCPHVDEVDTGTIEITWTAQGETYEFHSLAEYLAGFADTRMSSEAITDRIRHDLSVVPRIKLVSVTTTWDTAGLAVTVAARQ